MALVLQNSEPLSSSRVFCREPQVSSQRNYQQRHCKESTAGDVNRALKELSSLNCYSDVKFISHDSVFQQDGILQRQMLSRDGLHLSLLGTETIVTRIESEIKFVMAVPKKKETISIPPISAKENQRDSTNNPPPPPGPSEVTQQKQTNNPLLSY